MNFFHQKLGLNKSCDILAKVIEIFNWNNNSHLQEFKIHYRKRINGDAFKSSNGNTVQCNQSAKAVNRPS